MNRIKPVNSVARVSLLTCLAMFAFAGNSILCRLALKEGHIDPFSFTMLRLVSGALVLYLLVRLRSEAAQQAGSWAGAVSLFLYAIAFSLAYVNMETGVGALILFGAVQITMLLYGAFQGEHLTPLSILGLLVSIAGLAYLLLPGSSALLGTILLGETLTLRVVLACIAVLGGIALVLISKQRLQK